MITSKQRATLRSMCNTLPALYQIGKGGVTESVISQFDEALEANELIKASVLETCPTDAKETLSLLCEALDAEPVQAIGRKLCLYRRSKDDPRIEL